MAEISINFFELLSNYYKDFMSLFPGYIQNFINFFFLVMLVVIYSIFVWNLYRFISKKNPLGLNLNQYNPLENSFFARLMTGALYFIEYILILPFLIFFIFVIFTLFLIVLSKSSEVHQVLIISATVIGAVRITAYYKEDLSREISKMLPFTLLAVSVLNPYFFTDSKYIEKILTNLSQLPSLIVEISHYLAFIIAIEVILLIFEFIYGLFSFNELGNVEESEVS